MEQSKSLSSTMHILPCIYEKGHNNFVSQKFFTYTILHNKLSASLALPVVSFQPWWVQMTLPLLSFKIFRYDITDHNQFQLRKLLPPQVLFTPYFTLTSTSSSRTVKLITLSKLTHDFICTLALWRACRNISKSLHYLFCSCPCEWMKCIFPPCKITTPA